jgi:hypothetical protein
MRARGNPPAWLVAPTLLGLLGDTHAPQSYADGISVFAVPRGLRAFVRPR